MAAQNTDKFKKLARKWTAKIGAEGVADEAVTEIPLSSTTNLPTDTAVVATIDRVDVNGAATPTLEEAVIGVVSGSNLVDCVRGVEGTAQAHNPGASVEILVTAKSWNDMIDGFLAEHSQSGAHGSGLVTSLKASGAEVNTGTSDVKIVTPKAVADSNVSFPAKTETLTNKTLTSPVITTPTITNGTITKPTINGQVSAYTADSDGATITFNMAASNIHAVTLGGNRTLALSNISVGQCFIIRLLQDGTGSRTVTWFTIIKWVGGSAPTLTTTASKADAFGFICRASDQYDGYIIGQNL